MLIHRAHIYVFGIPNHAMYSVFGGKKVAGRKRIKTHRETPLRRHILQQNVLDYFSVIWTTHSKTARKNTWWNKGLSPLRILWRWYRYLPVLAEDKLEKFIWIFWIVYFELLEPFGRSRHILLYFKISMRYQLQCHQLVTIWLQW